MSADMTIDIFAETAYGKVALEKMGEVPDNFRLYKAGWVDPSMMKVTGAKFRKALSGPNKGILSIKVKGTDRVAYVLANEFQG